MDAGSITVHFTPILPLHFPTPVCLHLYVPVPHASVPCPIVSYCIVDSAPTTSLLFPLLIYAPSPRRSINWRLHSPVLAIVPVLVLPVWRVSLYSWVDGSHF